MFVFNIKFSAKKKTKIIFAVSAIVVAVVCILCMLSMHKNSVPDTATCDETGVYSLKADTREQQCSFFEQFGLFVDKATATSDEVTIPEQFNTVYNDYNNLQKQIGLNLERFSGKKVEKITYTLKNSKTKYAVILIYKGKVIGAHLTNGEYGSKNLPLN